MWLARVMQDQAVEVQQHWERFRAHAASWQQQVSRALGKLQDLQDSMHQEELSLTEMDSNGQGWHPDGRTFVNCMLNKVCGCRQGIIFKTLIYVYLHKYV